MHKSRHKSTTLDKIVGKAKNAAKWTTIGIAGVYLTSQIVMAVGEAISLSDPSSFSLEPTVQVDPHQNNSGLAQTKVESYERNKWPYKIFFFGEYVVDKMYAGESYEPPESTE